jgi:lysozyme
MTDGWESVRDMVATVDRLDGWEGNAYGIDVSHWQGLIDWSKVRAAGYRFALLKATDGLTFVDSMFERNWKGARSHDMVCGAYHFLRTSQSGGEQATHFISVVDTNKARWCVVDVETGEDAEETFRCTLDFLDAFRDFTSREALVYTAGWFWNPLARQEPQLASKVSGRTQLWVANYVPSTSTASVPWCPDGWDEWTLWQWSAEGTVAGIEGSCDLNIYSGTPEELEQQSRCIAP